MDQINEIPLVDNGNEKMETLQSELNEINNKQSKNKYVILGSIFAALFIAAIITIAISASSSFSPSNSEGELPGCQNYGSFSCKGTEGEMDEQYKDNLWNTPPRGEKGWIPGFQDMNVLTGYAQQQYEAGLKKCTVTIITKTAKDLELEYVFDGVAQTSNQKTFDSTYNKVLQVRIVAKTGEQLELDGIDFIWNAAPIKEREGDFRGGRKGAIVELFGWPDDDIAKECKNIAEAGYLGVKVFPHHEQIMSYQPYEDEMNPWYFMYQPASYRLQGRMGTRDQLRNMINTCRSYGLRVYADAVVNHMSGNGNDLSDHRNPGSGCVKWGNKTTSAPTDLGVPYYTPAYTYKTNPWTGRGENVLEYPSVPYGPTDFHCDKALNAWTDPNNLNTGWLVGLSDLDTSKEYVRQRICDYFVDMMSIGFTGFRIDAAKHIHPTDLAAIFGKFKKAMGGAIPSDFMTYLEVLSGGESWLLLRNGEYSYTAPFTAKLQAQNLTDDEIETIKIFWSGYPVEPNNDEGTLSNTRKTIQNDDHDQQSDGSSSRDMHDDGCVLAKGCAPEKHRAFEVKLFENPVNGCDNDNDYPIRFVLSSYYFTKVNGRTVSSIPDGWSDCDLCKLTCDYCRTRKYAPAYVEDAVAYEGTDYTRVHRDAAIINAMRSWMHLPSI